MYHYWFSGKRVLEKPGDILLANPDIDLNFCLCWANENWTRTWDGMDHDVLIRQEYKPEDPQQFLLDLVPFFHDPRYIKIDGKPVLLVYKAHIIPKVGQVFAQWSRRVAAGVGQRALYRLRPRPIRPTTATDAWTPPSMPSWSSRPTSSRRPRHQYPYMMDNAYAGRAPHRPPVRLRPPGDRCRLRRGAVAPARGHAVSGRHARLGQCGPWRKEGWSVWYGFSLERYFAWLQTVIAAARHTLPPDRRMIFINAWNEWGEGTYLEPDRATGYAQPQHHRPPPCSAFPCMTCRASQAENPLFPFPRVGSRCTSTSSSNT